MLSVLACAKKKCVRDHCLILFAYRFGLRESELSLLQVSDVRNGFCDVQRLKGSEHTRQAITGHDEPLLDAKRALSSWLRLRGDADGSCFLFTSRNGGGLKRRAIYDVFADAAFHAGIDAGRRNIHICKHSLAVHLRQAGASVDVVQHALGHSDPGTTLKYYYHTSQSEVTSAVTGILDKLYTTEVRVN
jgi:site-specific recombinase XerD